MEPGFLHEGAELDRIAEREWCSPIRRRLGAHVSLQCLRQGSHPGAPLDPAPDTNRHSPAGHQDPTHLTQRCWAIRKLLETMLAKHRLERRVREWDLQRARFQPLD